MFLHSDWTNGQMTHPGISEGRRQGHYVVEEEEELRGFGLERLMVSL